MKTIVVGYGSMGRRRIRLLQEIEKDCEIHCVDNNPSRQQQARENGVECYDNLQTAIIEVQPDAAFVCTSPGNHAEIILKLIEYDIHVFTELNLVNTDYDLIMKKSRERGVKVFMSSTLLYNRVIQKIQKCVSDTRKPLMYTYHVGQYLPDWHPWESYKDFFVGNKLTNGVREIYAIQLPWIISTFGQIERVLAAGSRCTDLEIDYDDSVIATFIHRNGSVGTLAVDVTSRKATTHLEIVGEELYLCWDGHADDLSHYSIDDKCMRQIMVYESVQHQEGYADTIIEEPYREEIEAFLYYVRNDVLPQYSIEKDKEILHVCDIIEKQCKGWKARH